jgi:hypothetical protein
MNLKDKQNIALILTLLSLLLILAGRPDLAILLVMVILLFMCVW